MGRKSERNREDGEVIKGWGRERDWKKKKKKVANIFTPIIVDLLSSRFPCQIPPAFS